MKEFYGKNWQQILIDNSLGDFGALWDLETEWFEEPNKRRGGWSGVAKIKLALPGGGEIGVFMKRQENHVTKTILHPVRGISTFQREFRNILRFIKRGVPTLEPVYFGQRDRQGKLQAILMTKELEGYQSLDGKQFCLGDEDLIEKSELKAILQSLAGVIHKMHSYNYQHNCLYPKHVFVKKEGDAWDVRLIDLEKLKWRFFKRRVIVRDIGTLYRYGSNYGLSLSDQIMFFRASVGEQRLSASAKNIWREVGKVHALKKSKSGR